MLLWLNTLQQNTVHYHYIVAATLAMLVIVMRLAVKLAVKHERIIATTLALLVIVMRLAGKIAVKHERIIAPTLALLVIVVRLAGKIAVKQRSAASADPAHSRQNKRGNQRNSHQRTFAENFLIQLGSSDGGVRKFGFEVGHVGKETLL